MGNQHIIYQIEETGRNGMGKTTKESKKIEAVFITYASPDLNRDREVLTHVAQYFAKEIKKRRIAAATTEDGK